MIAEVILFFCALAVPFVFLFMRMAKETKKNA